MPAIIKKIKIKIRGKAVPVDEYFLDLLAVARFDKKYEDDEVRKQVNSIVRDLVNSEPEISPQIVDQRIALSLLPKSKQAIILSSEA